MTCREKALVRGMLRAAKVHYKLCMLLSGDINLEKVILVYANPR